MAGQISVRLKTQENTQIIEGGGGGGGGGGGRRYVCKKVSILISLELDVMMS